MSVNDCLERHPLLKKDGHILYLNRGLRDWDVNFDYGGLGDCQVLMRVLEILHWFDEHSGDDIKLCFAERPALTYLIRNEILKEDKISVQTARRYAKFFQRLVLYRATLR